MATTLGQLRKALKSCRVQTNEGCRTLIRYRDGKKTPGAGHPLLFQLVPKARMIIVGSVPGGIASNNAKASYQALLNGQYCLGHKSAQGLGQIMLLAGKSKGIHLPQELAEVPLTEAIQRRHLDARARLGLHVTKFI